jgi:hypothetical protein
MLKPKDTGIADLLAENARLRKLAELLHDSLCPADSERFPEHEQDVCRVFWMSGPEQDRYWYFEVCKALGLQASDGDVSEWNSKTNHSIQIDTLFRNTH